MIPIGYLSPFNFFIQVQERKWWIQLYKWFQFWFWIWFDVEFPRGYNCCSWFFYGVVEANSWVLVVVCVKSKWGWRLNSCWPCCSCLFARNRSEFGSLVLVSESFGFVIERFVHLKLGFLGVWLGSFVLSPSDCLELGPVAQEVSLAQVFFFVHPFNQYLYLFGPNSIFFPLIPS